MEKPKPDIIKFEDLDFSRTEPLLQPSFMQRRSPIIVTLPDHQITPVDIQKMMEAGMNVARFKMSQSTKGDKIRLLGKVDKAALTCSRKYGVTDWPVATCVDLKTCIVKTGILAADVKSIPIKEGANLILTCNILEFDKCTEHKIFADNPYMAIDVKVGTEISIDEDEIILRCIAFIDDKNIKCIVLKGGMLANMRNVCFRGCKQSRPYITRKDLQIIRFALEYQVDIITVNYVRHVETLKKAKLYMGKKLQRPIIISGICTEQGLENIDEILQESDGIILVREIITYEMEASKRYRLPRIQKWLGAKCQQAGKPFYISGGVFQEALSKGNFSDAEVADVTNALLDGASGFILKDCNDTELLLQTIYMMNDLCRGVEPFTNSKSDYWRIVDAITMPLNAAEACAMACATIANQTNSRVIVLPTVTGRTAKALLSMRPACMIITISTKTRTTRLLHTYRNVVPLIYNGSAKRTWDLTVEARVQVGIEYAVKRGWLIYGDTYVTLQRGTETSSYCDTVRIWKVTIWKKAPVECLDEDTADNELED